MTTLYRLDYVAREALYDLGRLRHQPTALIEERGRFRYNRKLKVTAVRCEDCDEPWESFSAEMLQWELSSLGWAHRGGATWACPRCHVVRERQWSSREPDGPGLLTARTGPRPRPQSRA